ncbi:hypothetical protein [Roseobacter litoralis]|uniref:Uncharacterized protein n=1 Tax=Roseobacter litoralis (strain ATCC 49566 / DSM 6996 / JCM 21268 / NBRC 15278 / OCh 149) TaxID=391595 RepID=F7ZBP1_ROSLO|nr:hypothetical protein [Roseobacter litoralis]AEI95623.1 hypothetical protein RLO149_c037090 [Roseobacter litoralis Och 149]
MTVNLARARRLNALNRRNTDRMLVDPAAHCSQVNLPDDGTVAAYLIDALGHGCCVEALETETGWSKSTVVINLYKVAKKSGVGIRRSAKELHLVLPEGSDHIYPRAKVVATGTTLHPMNDRIINMPDQTA